MAGNIIKKIGYELQFKNTDYYTRISDKFWQTRYKRLLRKCVNNLAPLHLQSENAKLTLATLCNKRNFYESVAALYSFCFWKRDLRIHYHEDGTLTENEIEFLKKIFPGITVFRRSGQNLKINELLLSEGLVNSAHLRERFFLSIKLFDMINEKTTPYLLHIDSDVLFFSRPNQILDIVEKSNYNGCYNRDVNEMASFDMETIKKYISKPFLPMFNSGLILHNFDAEIFKFVDNIMHGHPEALKSWHLEQTFLAMYASEKGNFLGLPKEYDLARRERNAGNEIISEHYVHHTGYAFHKDFLYKISPLFKAH
jgi:hypothetical protein